MRISILPLICLIFTVFAESDNPVADPAAIVQSGLARFTILTDELFRFEFSPSRSWVDKQTMAITNRRLPVPSFTTSYNAGWLTISTSVLDIKYKNGSILPFLPENLHVTVRMGTKTVNWVPEQDDTGNLFGTFRTLDGARGVETLNCTLHDPSSHCTSAFISRNGWAVMKDTTPIFDETPPPEMQWISSRTHLLNSDAYFFGYGHNYLKALKDYTLIAGKVPVPPRFVFGVWSSRYWAFNDAEMRDLVAQYQQYQTPLDVLVVDMDWHMTFYKDAMRGKLDQAGLTPGWTGWTWDSHLFPDPPAFLRDMHDAGLRVTLNLHPGSGAHPHELRYPEIARALGVDPATKVYVPFAMENKTVINAFLDYIIAPLEKDGVDFWWLDWQQGESWTKIKGNNPTIWLNHIWWNIFMRSGNPNRPLIKHRYGGLGNHRYQIGFSGDVVPSWASLRFQTKFTLAASNVLFGYWSHDIGGHTEASPPELYTRWVQFGVFSPIFRTHCTKNAVNDRRIWTYPLENFVAMRAMLSLRERLVPYIYTHARIAHEEAISLIRPLYYFYPEEDMAYTASQQWGSYFFGTDFLVVPISQAMDTTTQITSVQVWLPKGCWVDISSQAIISGPSTFTAYKRIDEIAVYARCGAIIPLAPDYSKSSNVFGHSQTIPESLTLSVYPPDPATAASPGAVLGKAEVYEDDGATDAYKGSAFARTPFTLVDASPAGAPARTRLQVVVGPAAGSFPGMPPSRGYEIRMVNSLPPVSVKMGSVVIPQVSLAESRAAQAPFWFYDGESTSPVVVLAPQPTSQRTTVEFSYAPEGPGAQYLQGMVGRARRAQQVKMALDNLWSWAPTGPFQEDYPTLLNVLETVIRMSYRPETALAEAKGFAAQWKNAQTEVAGLGLQPLMQKKMNAYLANV